jgi:hypothetical protein
MRVIDKHRGGSGCRNSDYILHRTICCNSYCVEDDELLGPYLDPENLDRTFQLYVDAPCPLCGAAAWDMQEVSDLAAVPDAWRWATSDVAQQCVAAKLRHPCRKRLGV